MYLCLCISKRPKKRVTVLAAKRLPNVLKLLAPTEGTRKERNITGQKDTTEDMTRGREDKTPLKTMSSTLRKGVTDLSFILSLEDNCSSNCCWMLARLKIKRQTVASEANRWSQLNKWNTKTSCKLSQILHWCSSMRSSQPTLAYKWQWNKNINKNTNIYFYIQYIYTYIYIYIPL